MPFSPNRCHFKRNFNGNIPFFCAIIGNVSISNVISLVLKDSDTDSKTFSREATISRLHLSDFSICIVGYSQNRLISFDSRRISEERQHSFQFVVQS